MTPETNQHVVLMVESSDIEAELITILQEENIHVSTASTASEMLSLIGRIKTDLVILGRNFDYSENPDLALELQSTLYKDFPLVPILFCSNYFTVEFLYQIARYMNAISLLIPKDPERTATITRKALIEALTTTLTPTVENDHLSSFVGKEITVSHDSAGSSYIPRVPGIITGIDHTTGEFIVDITNRQANIVSVRVAISRGIDWSCVELE